MRKIYCAALAGASWAAGATAALAADLRVEIHGIQTKNGSVRVAVFQRAEDFNEKPMVAQQAPASSPTAVFVFRNILPGEYAISAFHDENSNGELDRNLFRIPTERYGFSRDAAGNMGPPSFDAAKIRIAAETQSIVINLR